MLAYWWVSDAAFGCPVVPLVNWRLHIICGSTFLSTGYSKSIPDLLPRLSMSSYGSKPSESPLRITVVGGWVSDTSLVNNDLLSSRPICLVVKKTLHSA